MSKKLLKVMIGAAFGMVVLSSAAMAEEAVTESDVIEDVQTEAETKTETEAKTETETDAETEAVLDVIDPFIDGSALLSDMAYKAGTIDEKGWSSEFLKMAYAAQDGVTMGAEQTSQLNDMYYERNGEDKVSAAAEMTALMEDGSYILLSVEVNPNNEPAADILERFIAIEEVTLPDEAQTVTICDKEFLTSTGICDGSKYMLGVCADEKGYVIAFRLKYSTVSAKKALLGGFEAEQETQEDTTAVPEEFENAEAITEAETEA